MSSKEMSMSFDTEGKITIWLMFSVFSACCGSLVFGYNMAVINTASSVIKHWIANLEGMNCCFSNVTCPENTTAETMTAEICLKSLSPENDKQLNFLWSVVVGLFPLGGMFGGLCTGLLADKLGRKYAMLLNAALSFVSGLVLFFSEKAKSHMVLMGGRLLMGFNAGLFSGLAPLYITEISPVNYRGCLGSLSQLCITISILLSNILGLDLLLGNEARWKFLFAFSIIPSILMMITLPLCPESPKFLLISKGEETEARKALIKLRQTEEILQEFCCIKDEAIKFRAAPKVTFCDMFRKPLLRWTLFLAVMLVFMQQFAGINFAIFYSSQVFEQNAKLSARAAAFATIGVLTVNMLMTILSTVIVEHAGRRTLLLLSMAGTWFTTICIVVFLYFCSPGEGKETPKWATTMSIAAVVFYIVSFAAGAGSVPWFFVSEVFDQSERANAQAVASGVHWFAASIIGFAFPSIVAVFGFYTFLFFTGFLSIFFIFTLLFIPETKGKRINQILEGFKESKLVYGRKSMSDKLKN